MFSATICCVVFKPQGLSVPEQLAVASGYLHQGGEHKASLQAMFWGFYIARVTRLDLARASFP